MNDEFLKMVGDVQDEANKKKIVSTKFQEINGELYPINIDAEVFRKKGYNISSEPESSPSTPEFDVDKEADEFIETLKNNGDLSQLNETTEESKPATVADQLRDIISESGDGYRARTLECIVSAVCFLMIKRYSEKASSMVIHDGKVKPIKIDRWDIVNLLCNRYMNGFYEFLHEDKPAKYYDDVCNYLAYDYDYTETQKVISCNYKEIKRMLNDAQIRVSREFNDPMILFSDSFNLKVSVMKPKKETDADWFFIISFIGTLLLVLGATALYLVKIYG